MMNPNFLLNTPCLPVVMAEDCNVPALRSPEVRVKRYRIRRRVRCEVNDAFLRMLTCR